MAEARQASLSELAKFGFVELSTTVSKLEQLVKLVGDPARTSVAQLALCADPDQALNALIDFAERDKTIIKRILGKPDSALRLCLLFGASSALTDFLRRHPAQLATFEKSSAKLATAEELNATITAAAAAAPRSCESAQLQLAMPSPSWTFA